MREARAKAGTQPRPSFCPKKNEAPERRRVSGTSCEGYRNYLASRSHGISPSISGARSAVKAAPGSLHAPSYLSRRESRRSFRIRPSVWQAGQYEIT